MSKLLSSTFKGLGHILGFLLRGYMLQRTTGADLHNIQDANYLNARNTGLLVNGDQLRLSEKESYQNLSVTAPVGVGKTTRLVVPAVMDRMKQRCSMVINDPKGEVFALTSGVLDAYGYEVVLFDPSNPTQSHRFNPLLDAKNDIELENIAQTLIWSGNASDKDPFWNHAATRLVSLLLKLLRNGDPKYFNLPNLHHLLSNFGSRGEGIDEFVASHYVHPQYPDDDSLLQEWKGIIAGSKGNTQSSILNVTLTALRALSNREVRHFLSGNDYDFSQLRERKTAVFLVTPADKQKYFSFLTSMFFSSIFQECMRAKHLTNRHSLPVYIIYDEAGNSYIPDFASIANTIRGYRVSLSMIFQTISQLELRYGVAEATAIRAALSTEICLPGCDSKTAQYFSELAGIVREAQRRDFTDSMINRNEYRLLNPNEIRTMQDNEALLVSKNRQPVKLTTKAYYEVGRFRRAAKFPPIQYPESPLRSVECIPL